MDEPTAWVLLQRELVLFAVIGLPLGAVFWFWAEQLAELFTQRAAPKASPLSFSKRGKSPITGRSSLWEDAVADVRHRTDARVFRVGVVVLLGIWVVRLLWKTAAVVF